MRRREFITLLSGVAVGWPFVAEPANLPTIGFMGSGTAAAQSEWTAAFLERLHELGWSEGRNIANRISLGGKGEVNALPKSQPNSSGSRST